MCSTICIRLDFSHTIFYVDGRIFQFQPLPLIALYRIICGHLKFPVFSGEIWLFLLFANLLLLSMSIHMKEKVIQEFFQFLSRFFMLCRCFSEGRLQPLYSCSTFSDEFFSTNLTGIVDSTPDLLMSKRTHSISEIFAGILSETTALQGTGAGISVPTAASLYKTSSLFGCVHLGLSSGVLSLTASFAGYCGQRRIIALRPNAANSSSFPTIS